MLTKKDLLNLNNRMLGNGAPVAIDNTGYNQAHYGVMSQFEYRNDLSDAEAYKIASVLLHYSNTQLTSFKDEIKETIEEYAQKIKSVKVVSFNRDQVELAWEYDKVVSAHIKNNMDRTFFRWKRPNGEWVLAIDWTYTQQLLDVMNAQGFDTTPVTMVYDNLDKLLAQEVKKELSQKIKLLVVRPENSIDTLDINFDYNKVVVEAIKSIPFAHYTKSTQTWTIYIEYSYLLYHTMKELKMSNLDLSELKPWADIIKGWNKEYKLIDTTKTDLPFTPYNFQPEDAKKLLKLKTGLNANEMGAGKTLEQVLIGESLPMKKLVICPPSLRINWEREIKMVNNNASVHIIYSDKKFKVVDGWNIIGYTSVSKFIKELEDECFQCIIMDEAHSIKAISNYGTPESQRAKACLRLCATSNYVFPVTGTPKTNRNKDVYNLLRAIRHPLARGQWSFSNYGKTYCDAKNNGFGMDYSGNSNDADLHGKLQPYMVRHLKSEVLPHLKKQRVIVPVEANLREYNNYIAEYFDSVKGKKSKACILAQLTKAKESVAISKVKSTIDFAKNLVDQGEKVVIMTMYNKVVEEICKAFKNNVVTITGNLTDKQKQTNIDEFQNGAPQVMVANIIAGGVGVTLTASHIMIMNDLDFTPGNNLQGEDRICRGNQKELCMIYYMCAHNCDMDQTLVNMMTEKSDSINTAIDAGAGDNYDLLSLVEDAVQKSNK